TAGDDESTSRPSCACQAGVRNGTVLAERVVSKGFTPVCPRSNRNCVQSTGAPAEAVACGDIERATDIQAATTAVRRTALIPDPSHGHWTCPERPRATHP